MSGKMAKLHRRAVRKEADKIRKANLDGFFDFIAKQNFFIRLRIATRILFKRVKI